MDLFLDTLPVLAQVLGAAGLLGFITARLRRRKMIAARRGR
jgi:hypothetical protein